MWCKLMNVMKTLVICRGKDEIVSMGVNMSGLCRAFPLLPDASFDDDELISCCCFNVEGVQKVHTDNLVLI